MRKAVTSALCVFPAGRLKNFALRMLGHDVHPQAVIGPILVVGQTRLAVGKGARIGPFNVIRSVGSFVMGEFAEIGQWNWISAAPFLVEASRSHAAGTFVMGEHSSLTSRHYVDASGGMVIGPFATVAGARSVFMTHGIDVSDNYLDTAPIIVGEYAMVGGGVNAVLGATIPARSVIAMGSVVVKGLAEPQSLYAGAPAKLKKALPGGRYFERTWGAVPVRPKAELPSDAGQPAL